MLLFCLDSVMIRYCLKLHNTDHLLNCIVIRCYRCQCIQTWAASHLKLNLSYSLTTDAAADVLVPWCCSGSVTCWYHGVVLAVWRGVVMSVWCAGTVVLYWQCDMVLSCQCDVLVPWCCSGSVTCLSLSIDGSTLASGSTDATVRLWNTQSQQCIEVIQHTGL